MKYALTVLSDCLVIMLLINFSAIITRGLAIIFELYPIPNFLHLISLIIAVASTKTLAEKFKNYIKYMKNKISLEN